MEKILDLRGKWQLKGEGLSHCEVYLPGTLDTNQVGHKDTPELATRFTRLHTWEGNAWYSREIGLPSAEGGRLLLKVERTRKLALFIEGKEIEVFEQGSLSTSYMFEITDFAGQLVKMSSRWTTNIPAGLSILFCRLLRLRMRHRPTGTEFWVIFLFTGQERLSFLRFGFIR